MVLLPVPHYSSRTVKPEPEASSTGLRGSAWEYSAKPFRIQIKGLPWSVAENPLYVKVMFEQIGLEDDFVRSRLHAGHLEVEMKSFSAVQRCMAHFESVHWRPFDGGKTCDDIAVECVESQDDNVDWEVAEKDTESDTGSRSTGLKSDDETGSSISDLLLQATSPLRSDLRSTSQCRGPFQSRATSRERSVNRGLASRRKPPPPSARQGVPLVVNYIPREAGGSRIMTSFERFGKVLSASVMRDRNGVSKCFGFINFADRFSAARAVTACQRGEVTMKDSAGKRWHVKATWSIAEHANADPVAPMPQTRATSADGNTVRRPQEHSVLNFGKPQPTSLRSEPLKKVATRAASCHPAIIRTVDWADVVSDEE